MTLVFPLPILVKGKWVMCILGLLKWREHPKYPAFRVVMRVEECGKCTRETEQNGSVEWLNSQILSPLPSSLLGFFCATEESESFLPKPMLGFPSPYDTARLWIFQVLLEGGRKALDIKNPKQLFLQEDEPLQFRGLMGWVNSRWRQMLRRHG